MTTFRARVVLGVLALILPSCVTPLGQASNLAVARVQEEALKTVQVFQQDPTSSSHHFCGSAFPIGAIRKPDGKYSLLFLTAKHVVDLSTETIVVWRFPKDAKKYYARVNVLLINQHPQWDAATFIVHGLPVKFAKTVVLAGYLPKLNSWVISAGHAECKTLVMHTGTVTGATHLPSFGPCIVSNALVITGMSGGPVFNRLGSVLGFTVAKGGDHEHYFLSVAALKPWLKAM